MKTQITFPKSNLRYTTILLILLLVSGIISSFTWQSGKLFIAKKGVISFTSDAPLELIQARSDKLQGVIDIENNTFAFSIPVTSFEGFNSALQRDHFNENYMETSKFPKAFFKGKIIEEIDFSVDGRHSIRAKGKLSIHGVEQERIIKSTLRIEKGVIYVETKFPVPLGDHSITIPKIVNKKIATEILVDIEAEFTRK